MKPLLRMLNLKARSCCKHLDESVKPGALLTVSVSECRDDRLTLMCLCLFFKKKFRGFGQHSLHICFKVDVA